MLENLCYLGIFLGAVAILISAYAIWKNDKRENDNVIRDYPTRAWDERL